ncbi:hypothetical protein [Vibrio penaeicida]|uniref:COG3904 family protein n=1 Tax=Vibrio penaeicida TaxID=104609 RepID=UPI000CE9E412|nr:hypothetical protein [Vibrio penaeicida]
MTIEQSVEKNFANKNILAGIVVIPALVGCSAMSGLSINKEASQAQAAELKSKQNLVAQTPSPLVNHQSLSEQGKSSDKNAAIPPSKQEEGRTKQPKTPSGASTEKQSSAESKTQEDSSELSDIKAEPKKSSSSPSEEKNTGNDQATPKSDTDTQISEPQGLAPENTKSSEKQKQNPAQAILEALEFAPDPSLPLIPQEDVEFRAPEKFKHPLQYSNKLTFMLGEDEKGNYLYGEGAITEGAFSKFQAYVNHYKKQNIELNRLMLHSPGGLINEGIKIGNYIHENSWTTDLDKYMRCYSSCGFIYASGVEKRIQKGAEVGFHRPYIPNKPDTIEFIQSVYQDYQPYWSKVKGNPDLYDKFMKKFGRNDMYILTEQDIEKYMSVERY